MSDARTSAGEWFADRRAQPAAPTTRIFDMGDLIGTLRRSRRLIAMTVAATTVLGLAAGIMLPKRYQASSQLFVDSRGLKILANDVAPQAAVETAIADFESQLKILGSGSVMQRVVERERLTADPTFIPPPGLIGRLRSLLPGAQASDAGDRMLLAAAILERMVTINRSDRSFVVDVVVTDKDAARAARLANAVAETYLENRLNNRRDLARRLGTEVTDRLQDLRERVEASEKRLNEFKTVNNLVYSGGALVAEQDLTELNNQLNQARARTARAKSRLDQLSRLSGNTGTAATAEVLDSPTIVQLRVRIAEANRQAAELRRNLGPLHPDIQAADARVREANAAIAGEIERRRSSVRNDYEQALASERILARQITDLKNKSSDIGQSLISLRELERAVEANKKIYEEFMLRSRELAEQQGIFANASYIITPAVTPSQPSGLTLPLLVGLGFFAGFPLGIGLALGRTALEQGAGRQIARPFSSETNAGRLRPHHALATIDRGDLEAHLARHCLTRVAVPPDALSDFAQSIESAVPSAANMSLLIVSAGDDAPGAEVSAALAACWAYDGHEIVAVDADAARARLSTLAAATDAPGLFDRLHRNVEEFVRWNRKGLPHLLTSLDPNQRRDINGARRIVAQRLEDIAASVDNLLLDAGDLAKNDFAQALCRAATSAIIVAPAGAGSSEALEANRELLARYGVPLAGVVEITGIVRKESAPAPAVIVEAASVPAAKPSRFAFFRRKPKTSKVSGAATPLVKGA